MPIAEYKIEAASNFTGSGSTNSSETLSMNFTVRVVDILENGVLVIRGDRRIVMRNESISMVLTGLVRTKDISATNTVNSNRVADAHIYYETDGEVSRGSRPGYFWRLFQFLNPM
jgi:flagellar L-ring protein precursor FlgH